MPPGSVSEKGDCSPPGQHCTCCLVSDDQQPQAETAAQAFHQTPDPPGAVVEVGPQPRHRHHHHNGLPEVVSRDKLHFEWAEIAS